MILCCFRVDNAQACRYNDLLKAGVAQLVEYKLPKLGVAGSRPVARSNFRFIIRELTSRIFCLSDSCPSPIHVTEFLKIQALCDISPYTYESHLLYLINIKCYDLY